MKDESFVVEIAFKPSRIGAYAKAFSETSYPDIPVPVASAQRRYF
jgi:hypothetical protein